MESGTIYSSFLTLGFFIQSGLLLSSSLHFRSAAKLIRAFEREHPDTPPIYIAACSGTGEARMVEEVRREGFQNFLLKPVCSSFLVLSHFFQLSSPLLPFYCLFIRFQVRLKEVSYELAKIRLHNEKSGRIRSDSPIPRLVSRPTLVSSEESRPAISFSCDSAAMSSSAPSLSSVSSASPASARPSERLSFTPIAISPESSHLRPSSFSSSVSVSSSVPSFSS
jgi:hypothetical protein